MNPSPYELGLPPVPEQERPQPFIEPAPVPQGVAFDAPEPVSPEAIVLGTGLGSLFDRDLPRMLDRGARAPDEVLGASNVLARAARKAFDSVDFEDVPDLSPGERDEFVSKNASRYKGSVLEEATAAADEEEAATEPLEKAARAKLEALIPESAPMHLDVAVSLAKSLDEADSALRTAGLKDFADELTSRMEPFDEFVALSDSGSKETPDAGRVFEAADDAYRLLRTRITELPPEATDTLLALKRETERPELFGEAAGAVGALRAASDLVADTGVRTREDLTTLLQSAIQDQDQQSRGYLESYLNAQHARIDAYDQAGVDTERLSGAVDKLELALERGDRLGAETRSAGLRRAGKDSVEDDAPISDVLAQAMAEAGVGGSPDTLLSSMGPTLARDVGQAQKGYRYERSLRSIQEGARLTLKKAARGMVGGGAPRSAPGSSADRANEAFTAGYPDETAAFEARRSTLTRLKNDPGAMVQALSRGYGELASTHPEVFQGIVGAATRATAILSESMPASLAISLQHPNGLPPAVDDIRRWSRTYMAVIEPETFTEDLRSGQAWPEQANAFAAAYPTEWARLTADAQREAQIRGPALTPQEATYLDIIFDVGDSLGGMWSSKGAAAIAAANQTRAEQAQKQGGAPQGAQDPNAPQMATAALSMGPSVTPVG